MKIRSVSRGWSVVGVALLFVACAAKGQVIFEDDFESGDLSKSRNGFRWTSARDTAVSSERARSGRYSLKFTFEGGPSGDDAFSEQRFDLGGNYPEVWVRYDIYIPQNYYHRNDPPSANNKGYLYLWSGDYGRPSGPGMGPNFWPKSDGTSFASHYVWGPGLDRHYNHLMPNAVEAADRGKWLRIVVHYKYASSRNNDGVAEIWKTRDGVRQKILNIQDGAWYVTGQPGFSVGYLLGWANSGFDETTVFYIDNIVFSTQSLLDDDSVPPPTARAAPVAPTNLVVR